MTARDRTGKFTAERTTTTITERITIETPPAPSDVLIPEGYARLTAPLKHYRVPVILTDAERWADDDYRRQLRHSDGDPWPVYQLSAEARENTLLLAACGVPMAGYDGILPDEARAILDRAGRLPQMMP